MRIIKSGFLCTMLAILPAAAAAVPNGITVQTQMDTTVVEMADVTHLRVRVISPEGLKDVRLTPQPEAGTEFGGVDIISVSTDTVADTPGKQIVDYDFTIQPFDPGMITIPPFGVLAGDSRDTSFSQVSTLKVLPVDVDSLETINPMAEVADARTRWFDYVPSWTLWIVLAIAAAVLCALCFIYMKRRRKAAETEHSKPIPPYELAVARLTKLRESKLGESGNDKLYYTELVDILRQYLEGRFGIYAMEMTSPQILRALRKNEETRLSADEISRVLEIADFVKFAKVRPLPDDNTRSLRRATEFVENTKPKPEPDPSETETSKS